MTIIATLAVALLGLPPEQAPSPDTLTLAVTLRTVLETHPSLAGADARAGEAASAVKRAEAARLPSLSASLSAVRFEEPMPVAPFHGLDLQTAPIFDRTLFQGRAELTYTLWDGGARGARVDQTRARRRVAGARVETLRQEVLDGAVDAYLAALTARDVLEAQQLRREELQAERERVGRFLQEGTAARVELLRAQAELSAADAEVASAETRLELIEAELARLLELPPGSLAGRPLQDVRLADAGFAPERPAQRRPTSGEPGSDHPTLLASRRSLDAARAATREARATWLPDIHVTAGFHEFGAPDSRFTGEWQGGLRVAYPLFTGGARSGAVDAAEARVRAARADVEAVERQLSRAEDRARAAEREARARVASLTDAVEQFEELTRVEALALAEGVGVQRDFLRAQAGLLRARAGLAEARRAVILARVRLARARGRLDLDWINRHVETLP